MSNVLFGSNNQTWTYEYFQNKNICRLCWNMEGVNDIFSKRSASCEQTAENEFAHKMKDCLNIEFYNDSFPNKACNKCYLKVEEFYEFKSSCQEAETKLQALLKKFQTNDEAGKDCEVKTESENCVFKNCEKLNLPVEYEGSSCISDYQHNRSEIKTKDINIEINYSKCVLSNNRIVNNSDSENDCHTSGDCEDFSDTMLDETSKLEKAKITSKYRLKNQSSKSSCKKRLQQEVLIKFKKKYKQKRSPTYCNICRSDLESKEKLDNHNASSHGIEAGNLFKCFGCERRFKNRKARLGHEANFCKGLKEGYKCGQCNRFLPRRSTYEAHMRDHRENPEVELPENIFQCIKCYKLFNTKLCLKEHMAEHDSLKKNYVCESCGRVFTRQDYLYKHRLTHTGIKQHTCPHCSYRTAQKSSLNIHIRKHTGERPYSCDLCPQRCISSSNLHAHRRRHLGDKTFQCTICQKKFGYKISLEEHVASVHERSQAFPCELCGALYTRARGLRRHLHAKHGKQNVDKLQPKDSSTCDEVSNNQKDVVSNKCNENVYLKIVDSGEKKVALNDSAVFEIKEGEEFVLLNGESGVMLTKMY